MNPETKSIFDNPEASLNAWLDEIGDRWKNIPPFMVNSERLKHLAVICDGNRRAAKERGLNPYFGHRAGIEVIKGIARACRQWNIRTLTFWTWSTENWEREKEQVKFVMDLAEKFLSDTKFFNELTENQVKFTHFGRRDRLPDSIIETLKNLENQTAKFNQYRLNLAMDYGGVDEMARAIARIFESFKQGIANPEMIERNPQAILGFLDTASQVLPDLVIRTGVKEGEIPHTSGFMPLQTAYSGWIFLPDLFPNLTPQTLLPLIRTFLNYERRKGK